LEQEKNQSPFGTEETTERGFPWIKFEDSHGNECSLQISSAAVVENEDGTVDNPLGWVWLGIDDAKPSILKTKARELGLDVPPGEVTGWMPYPMPGDVSLHTRMHLNEEQVRGLMERLQNWLDNGTFTRVEWVKARLRSWDRDISFEDYFIKVHPQYDFGKGPHHPDNEDYCPVVGSNQEIVEIDDIRPARRSPFAN